MNISLSPELTQWVDEKVKSGQYPSSGDVIKDALQLLKESERHLSSPEMLRHKIKIGLDQLARGEGIPGPQVHEEMKQRSEERRRAK